MKNVLDLLQHRDLKRGIVFVVLAWLSVSSMYAVAKLLGDQTNIPTMVFFRNLLGLMIIIPWISKKWPKSLKVKNLRLIFIRSITGLLNLVFMFLAIQQVSLVNATLLNNTAPLIIPFVIWAWMKVPMKLKIWPAILTGFIGVALILQPNKSIFNIGAIYALLSGFCLAISIVTMRQSSRQEAFYTFMLYFFGIGVILISPFAIAYWKVENGMTLLGLLAIGLFSAIGQLCLFYGLKFGKARQLAPFTYSTVVFSGIYEWLIWGMVPAFISYIGMSLIIASGIWIVLESRPPKNV